MTATDVPALVTVSHDSEPELGALLRSVDDHLPGAEVIVVDNASSDGSVEVGEGRPSVRVVALDQNVGFGRACNRGLEEVRAPVTALLNPDVELLDDSLIGLAHEALRSDRRERLLAPLVLSNDGSRQDTVHPAPCTAADLIRAVLPPVVVPGAAGVPLAPWRSPVPRRVGWAVGCALVARTDTLRRLGPFDETIFMYGEDMELGLRADEQGVQTWFWPEARVLHHQAHSSLPAFGGEPFLRHAQGRHDAVLRSRGRRAALMDDAAQAVTFTSRMALKTLLGRPASRERRQLRALMSVRRG